MNDRAFRLQVLNELKKEAKIYDDVAASFKSKGFEQKNEPKFGGAIRIPGALPGVAVMCPNNPIINGKYNVMFQVRSGHSPAKAGINAIIVTAEAGGMASSQNTKAYGNRAWINKQLGMIYSVLSKHFGKGISIGKLGISSFSGGFGAVSRVLSEKNAIKDPGTGIAKDFDAAINLDGLHAGKRGNPSDIGMKPWLEFAEKAKKDPSKKFTYLYTAVDPTNYASTSDTARYLLDKLKIENKKTTDEDTTTYAGVKPAGIAREGGFTAIELFERKSDKPGYGYRHENDNRPGTMGYQHILASRALPEIWNESLKDWNG